MKVIPHPMLQQNPTRQQMTVNSCRIPTKKFSRNDPILASAVVFVEKRGYPRQNKAAMPLKMVPVSKYLHVVGKYNVEGCISC